MEIRSVSSLIDVMGGPSFIAKELKKMGATISLSQSITRWKNVQTIPLVHWSRIIIIAQKKGMNLDTEKILALIERNTIDV